MGLAVLLVVSGLALWWWLAPTRSAFLIIPALLAGVWLGIALPDPCETETSYYCLRVEQDVDNPSGRTLWLDTLRHAYVDLDDPTELRFTYTRMLAAVADATSEGPIDVLHIGGGGFTMPRWLEATRPGSSGVVLELDAEIVAVAEERLGWEPSPEVDVLVGDARLGIRRVDQSSADLAIGDAFGGVAVPWHLTTGEFVGQVAAVLRPDGVYAANIIDGSEMAFLRAEAATFATVFEYVAVLSLPERFGSGGNFLVMGSDEPVPADEIIAAGSTSRPRSEGADRRRARRLHRRCGGPDRRPRTGRPVAHSGEMTAGQTPSRRHEQSCSSAGRSINSGSATATRTGVLARIVAVRIPSSR